MKSQSSLILLLKAEQIQDKTIELRYKLFMVEEANNVTQSVEIFNYY